MVCRFGHGHRSIENAKSLGNEALARISVMKGVLGYRCRRIGALRPAESISNTIVLYSYHSVKA
jgi:hypothetical protein